MSYRWIQLLAFLQDFFRGAKSTVMQTSIVFGPKFQGGRQKCLHLSRGLLRNDTEVKWHSVGLTMTSIVGEVTSEHTDVVVTQD